MNGGAAFCIAYSQYISYRLYNRVLYIKNFCKISCKRAIILKIIIYFESKGTSLLP